MKQTPLPFLMPRHEPCHSYIFASTHMHFSGRKEEHAFYLQEGGLELAQEVLWALWVEGQFCTHFCTHSFLIKTAYPSLSPHLPHHMLLEHACEAGVLLTAFP